MSVSQALVRTTAALPNGNGNGNGNGAHKSSSANPTDSTAPALTDELVNKILQGRGLRGWWRLARVARVLGLFTLYLYLDTYEVRAGFNRRMSARWLEEARTKGFLARARAFATGCE